MDIKNFHFIINFSSRSYSSNYTTYVWSVFCNKRTLCGKNIKYENRKWSNEGSVKKDDIISCKTCQKIWKKILLEMKSYEFQYDKIKKN
jgi:hypothetical protein